MAICQDDGDDDDGNGADGAVLSNDAEGSGLWLGKHP